MDGNFRFRFGSPGSRDGHFQFPSGVALTREGNIVVADSMNNRIQVSLLPRKPVNQGVAFKEIRRQSWLLDKWTLICWTDGLMKSIFNFSLYSHDLLAQV